MRIYRIAKENKEKEFLTPEEREEVKNRFKDIQCSFAKDKDGYYCYTHRARSESYPTISKIPQSKVDFINSTSSNHSNTKTAQLECFEDVLYSVREAQESILREYYDKRRKKGSMMSWSVIPFDRLKKIWEDYAQTGVVRDERGIDDIANSMLKILARLQASTDLAGHSQGGMGGEDVAEELGFKPIDGRNSDFYWDFLETPYGSPVSDFGLPQLWKIAEQLFSARNAEDKLLLIDQMLNVVHQRGDLAALFIEGGSAALSQLFLGIQLANEETQEYASVHGWYKAAKMSEEIWNNVDWNKSNKEIAQELRAPFSTVVYRRPNMDPNYHKPKKTNCEDINWEESNWDIAKKQNKDIWTVRRLRQRCAPDTINTDFSPVGIDWSIVGPQIDWKNRKNIDIAVELGIDPTNISRQRSIFAPKTLQPPRTAFYDWKNIDWNKSNKEIVQHLIEKHHLDSMQLTPSFLNSLYQRVSLFRNRKVKEDEEMVTQGLEGIPRVASKANWYKTAVADGEFRDWKDKVNSIKDEIRNLKKEDKDIDGRVKKLEKVIDDLNIGNRMFSEVKGIFTSLQRKMERAEAVAQEWKNYKKEMDDNIKKQVEKHTKARIGDVIPKAY